MRIKISTTVQWPIERQIPQTLAKRGITFVINDTITECDAWLVYQDLYRPDETICPPNRVILYTYEPPELHTYPAGFTNQFSSVVTCQKLPHQQLILKQQAQPWLAGIVRETSKTNHVSHIVSADFEDLVKLGYPEKTKAISAICSRRSEIPGHAKRLAFLDMLAGLHDAKLDLFGYGHKTIADKFEALLPYSHHLVLENSIVPNYWTEKLSDAYLGYCMPIVWGCPNLGDYFPAESFISLDTSSPEAACAQVLDALKSKLSDSQKAAIVEARRRVLYDYNLFFDILRLADPIGAESSERIKLFDQKLFQRGGGLRRLTRPIKDTFQRDQVQYFMRGGWKQFRRRDDGALPK